MLRYAFGSAPHRWRNRSTSASLRLTLFEIHESIKRCFAPHLKLAFFASLAPYAFMGYHFFAV